MQLEAVHLRQVRDWWRTSCCPAGPLTSLSRRRRALAELPCPFCSAVGAESAIVIEDLPLEENGDSGEDSRAAAYQEEIANMADKAKAEELTR